MSEVRLQVKNLCKNFGITKAVQNVSFNVNKGEVHALIGENGSGKSTLTNMLTGIYSIGSGQFILDGKEIHPKNQVEANNEGVSIIVQELGTLSGLTVAENIFLGHEDQFVHFGIKNTNAMNKKATELLKQYGFDRIKAADMIDNYNFEDRKLVEIVKATYFDPKIVVIDETTTALSQEGREELYKHMERIRKSGNTVIFISHDLPEILDKSDTITILRDGVYIDTVKSKDVTEDDLKKLMVGREVTGDYYRADYGEKVSDEVVLSVKNVTVPGLIEDVTFDLHKGEILGFGGLSESGMHEIGKAIFGASYDRTGSVTLADGTQINDIPTAIKHSIAYTSKDRDNESVVLNQSIGDNICLPSLDELAGKSHLLSDKKRKEFADKYCDSPLTYLVGSGNLEDWATCYGMCIMEEMQWMRTRPISAANFFHGTLEVIERDIPVILIKGEDKTRPEMDRVEKFVNTISANVTVFDSKDFELQGISDEFRGLLSPIVMRSAFQRVSTHLEHNRRHPLAIRRYYRRLDY